MSNQSKSYSKSESVFSVNKNNKTIIAKLLLKGLNEFRNDGNFCDIALKVGDETIKAHKNVLTACSPYFMAMFAGHFSESRQQEIHLTYIDPDSLKVLIEYMYTRNLKIDLANVRDVLVTASFLEISIAEDMCCKLLLGSLKPENCVEYIVFAGANLIEQLLVPAIKMATSNFHCIFAKDDFLQIQFEEFKQLVRQLKESGQPADLILVFALRWVKHSPEDRVKHQERLLKDIDPLGVSSSILNSSEMLTIQFEDKQLIPDN